MPSHFALLIAASVVFAPGWYGQEAPQHPRGSDLVARVLAPTVDEGAIREATTDARHQLGVRQAKRWRPSFTVAGVIALGLGAITLALLWAVASHCESLPRLFRFRYRFSRAPPRLQPA